MLVPIFRGFPCYHFTGDVLKDAPSTPVRKDDQDRVTTLDLKDRFHKLKSAIINFLNRRLLGLFLLLNHLIQTDNLRKFPTVTLINPVNRISPDQKCTPPENRPISIPQPNRQINLLVQSLFAHFDQFYLR